MKHNNPNSNYTTSQQGSDSVLLNLLNRNNQMVSHYEGSAEALKGDDQLSTYLAALIEDHKRWAGEIKDYLSNLPGTPHTPSVQDKSFLQEEAEALSTAIATKNHPQLYQLGLKANQSLEQFYGECLSNSNLNEDVEKLLENQIDQILDQQRRLDRLSKVPV